MLLQTKGSSVERERGACGQPVDIASELRERLTVHRGGYGLYGLWQPSPEGTAQRQGPQRTQREDEVVV